jgi:hypothetical protein
MRAGILAEGGQVRVPVLGLQNQNVADQAADGPGHEIRQKTREVGCGSLRTGDDGKHGAKKRPWSGRSTPAPLRRDAPQDGALLGILALAPIEHRL